MKSVSISSPSDFDRVEPEPEVRAREPTNDEVFIKELVLENWPLLTEAGWKHLNGALKHYRDHGLEYLQRDLTAKRERVERASLAARTCVHCLTVYEEIDQVQPCFRCGEPICVSSGSSCLQKSCFRKQGYKNRGMPQVRQRR